MHHLYLIRHGTTQWIEARRVQGATDSPLSTRGREEARCTAGQLRGVDFDAVFCSPLGRTRQTADILCADLQTQPVFLDDLREMNFGVYEGFEYVETAHGAMTLRLKLQLLARMVIAQLSGETLGQVKRRARAAWSHLCAIQQHGRVLVIAHGVILNALLAHLLSKEEYRRIKPVRLQPCAVTELYVPAVGSAQIIRLNDCDHLPL